MRSTAHVKGHPIHPALIVFPFAYLVGGALVDAGARATRRSDWFRTARHMNALGLGSALVAAVPGVIDYLFAVPPRSSARTRATDHMIANLSALTLFCIAQWGRRERDDRPAWWAMTAEACGAGLMTVAGWLGGTLVYRNQIGVDHRYADGGKWQSATIAEPSVADGYVDVGSADDLQVDQMKLIHIGDRRIVLARAEAGFVAFDDRCTHKGGPLSDGTLACNVVQCPWHGSQFDVTTGAVKHGPARDPIETYRVRQIDGRLRIEFARRLLRA